MKQIYWIKLPAREHAAHVEQDQLIVVGDAVGISNVYQIYVADFFNDIPRCLGQFDQVKPFKHGVPEEAIGACRTGTRKARIAFVGSRFKEPKPGHGPAVFFHDTLKIPDLQLPTLL